MGCDRVDRDGGMFSGVHPSESDGRSSGLLQGPGRSALYQSHFFDDPEDGEGAGGIGLPDCCNTMGSDGTKQGTPTGSHRLPESQREKVKRGGRSLPVKYAVIYWVS